jgi:hypothetical protein
MLQTLGNMALVLNILNEFLNPIAAAKRCKRFLEKVGFEITPIQLGTLALLPEEFDQLSKMGALPILLRGKERFQEIKQFVPNLEDWEA